MTFSAPAFIDDCHGLSLCSSSSATYLSPTITAEAYKLQIVAAYHSLPISAGSYQGLLCTRVRVTNRSLLDGYFASKNLVILTHENFVSGQRRQELMDR